MSAGFMCPLSKFGQVICRFESLDGCSDVVGLFLLTSRRVWGQLALCRRSVDVGSV